MVLNQMHDQTQIEIYKNIRRKKIAASILIFVLMSTLVIATSLQNHRNSTNLKITNLPSYGEVMDFTLTNTRNETYTFSQDNGKIRLVNFFYTECPGDEGCSLVTFKLAQLFSKIGENQNLDIVRFVSISFDYINDTIEDLEDYAMRYTDDTENWQFLTGNRTEIEQVTDDWSYYFELTANITNPITLNQHPGGELDPYDHSFIVYVIDQNNIIRKFLLGNFWLVEDALRSLEFLINE